METKLSHQEEESMAKKNKTCVNLLCEWYLGVKWNYTYWPPGKVTREQQNILFCSSHASGQYYVSIILDTLHTTSGLHELYASQFPWYSIQGNLFSLDKLGIDLHHAFKDHLVGTIWTCRGSKFAKVWHALCMIQMLRSSFSYDDCRPCRTFPRLTLSRRIMKNAPMRDCQASIFHCLFWLSLRRVSSFSFNSMNDLYK